MNNKKLPDNWLNDNTPISDEMIQYLINKYMYSNSIDANIIFKLIRFYNENNNK